MSENEMSFGDYIESIRKSKRKSIRQTAFAIGEFPPNSIVKWKKTIELR